MKIRTCPLGLLMVIELDFLYDLSLIHPYPSPSPPPSLPSPLTHSHPDVSFPRSPLAAVVYPFIGKKNCLSSQHHQDWLDFSWGWLTSIGLREDLMGK